MPKAATHCRGKNYSAANTQFLLDLIEKSEPYGVDEWTEISLKFNAHFGGISGENRSGEDYPLLPRTESLASQDKNVRISLASHDRIPGFPEKNPHSKNTKISRILFRIQEHDSNGWVTN